MRILRNPAWPAVLAMYLVWQIQPQLEKYFMCSFLEFYNLNPQPWNPKYSESMLGGVGLTSHRQLA